MSKPANKPATQPAKLVISDESVIRTNEQILSTLTFSDECIVTLNDGAPLPNFKELVQVCGGEVTKAKSAAERFCGLLQLSRSLPPQTLDGKRVSAFDAALSAIRAEYGKKSKSALANAIGQLKPFNIRAINALPELKLGSIKNVQRYLEDAKVLCPDSHKVNAKAAKADPVYQALVRGEGGNKLVKLVSETREKLGIPSARARGETATPPDSAELVAATFAGLVSRISALQSKGGVEKLRAIWADEAQRAAFAAGVAGVAKPADKPATK